MDRKYVLFATYLASRLQEVGHTAVFAGGYVRDRYLGKPGHDIDVATSASPTQVKELFQDEFKIVPVGESFGVIRIIEDGYDEYDVRWQVEVATFRTESGYSDGRRPDKVEFVKDIYMDLARRDFTINAMAIDPISGQVFDPYKGKYFIQDRTIRTVGNPDERFAEDYLRMLRAIRFAGRLNFDIESETRAAIIKNAEKIKMVSAERIAKELVEIVKYQVYGLTNLFNCGLAEHILPGVGYNTRLCVALHILLGGEYYNNETVFAILLNELTPTEAWKLATELKLTCAGVNTFRVLEILENQDQVRKMPAASKTKQFEICEAPWFLDTANFCAAIDRQSLNQYIVPYFYHQRRGNLKIGQKPLITGDIMIQQGYKPGKQFGQFLKKAKEAQVNGEFSDIFGAMRWFDSQCRISIES